MMSYDVIYGVIAFAVVVLGALVFRYLRRDKAIVTRLMVYPVKSCAGVQVRELQFDHLGVKYDRRFMIFDTVADKMVSMREKCRLSLVYPTITETGVHLTSMEPKTAHIGSVFLPFKAETPGEEIPVRIFNAPAFGEVVSEAADRWINTFIEADPSDIGPAGARKAGNDDSAASASSSEVTTAQPPFRYRIVRTIRPRPRTLELQLENPEPSSLLSDKLAFQDDAQVMVANLSSWIEMCKGLRSKGFQPAYIDQMRPNILLSGPKAWNEDDWGILQGPGVLLRRQAPCQRCILTTVDPITAKADPAMNPLAWLRHTRRPEQWLPKTKATKALGADPMFGVFMNVERRLSRLPEKLRRAIGAVSASELEVVKQCKITQGDEMIISKRSYLPVL